MKPTKTDRDEHTARYQDLHAPRTRSERDARRNRLALCHAAVAAGQTERAVLLFAALGISYQPGSLRAIVARAEALS